MASADESPSRFADRFDVDAATLYENRTLLAVVGVTVLALVVRLVELGVRIFHWDEGRVGYWILRYHETGEYFYRPIIHGPFIAIVDDFLFAFLPVSDFAARLPVAIVGGLLPLAAWLLRDRLRPSEVVGVALFFALNPLLVYYSRFMRSDVLVGGFAVFAFAFFVRAVDARRPRLLYASSASLALAFTAKENALVYVLCFLGAAALVADHRLVRAVSRGETVRGTLRRWVSEGWRRLADESDESNTLVWAGKHLLGAVAVFFAVIVFFYAPRPDIWQALTGSGSLASAVEQGTFGALDRFVEGWLSGRHQNHDYLPFVFDYLETLAWGAGVLVVFAVVGFVADGYDGSPRALVAVAVYWGAVSVVGYPVATDIKAPWAVVHAVLPLAIPAGIGLAALARSARASLDELGRPADVRSINRATAASVALAGLVLLGATAGVVGANVAYWNAADNDHNEILQWAQPENDMKETLADVEAVSRENEGTDVLFYGTVHPNNADNTLFYVDDESSLQQPPPGGPAWHSRLPLPWYLESYGAEINSTEPGTDPETVAEDAPPVVVAYAWNRSDLEPALPGYQVHTHDFKLWGEEVVVFVDREALAAARGQ